MTALATIMRLRIVAERLAGGELATDAGLLAKGGKPYQDSTGGENPPVDRAPGLLQDYLTHAPDEGVTLGGFFKTVFWALAESFYPVFFE
jgi:hypothetical protein